MEMGTEMEIAIGMEMEIVRGRSEVYIIPQRRRAE
jgi:hypothetical protein